MMVKSEKKMILKKKNIFTLGIKKDQSKGFEEN